MDLGRFPGMSEYAQSIIDATKTRRESAVRGVLAGAKLLGIGSCLFDGERKGGGRNSVVVPGKGSVGCNAGQFIGLERIFVCAYDLGTVCRKFGILRR